MELDWRFVLVVVSFFLGMQGLSFRLYIQLRAQVSKGDEKLWTQLSKTRENYVPRAEMKSEFNGNERALERLTEKVDSGFQSLNKRIDGMPMTILQMLPKHADE